MIELRKPYAFQQEIIDRFKDESSAGLFMDVGTGKSTVLANLVRHKMNTHREILATIIFCPIVMLQTWKDELLASTRIPPEMIGLVMGSKAKRIKTLKDPKHKVLIINYEAMRSDEIKEIIAAKRFKIIVLDESQAIKSRTSKVFKNIKAVSANALYRYILTATPIGNNHMDIWAQLDFLASGEVFSDRFYSFQNKYFVDVNAKFRQRDWPDWQVNESLLGEFKNKIAEKTVTKKASECLDLPELVTQQVPITMAPDQTKSYLELKRDLITWLDAEPDTPMVVQHALVKLLRLNGIVSGFMTLEDESIVKFKSNPRLDALMQIVEQTAPHKLIVFAVYKANYEDITKRLEKSNIEYVEIHGGVSTKNKLEAVKTFQDPNSTVRVCLIHPKSGGAGITLTQARYSVFYSRGFSITDDTQARGRNYRAGSINFHNTVFHFDLVSRNTIDDEILSALKNKKQFANSLLSIKRLIN